MSDAVDRTAMVSDVTAASSDLRAEMGSMKSDLRAEMAAMRSELRADIKREGRTTRRHFNVMVEKVEAAVKIVAEVNAHHGTVLDDHEARLKSIEKRV
ncbi:MAG: hypothetical protein ACRD1V_15705 [Vicinamibacterales bacterium]